MKFGRMITLGAVAAMLVGTGFAATAHADAIADFYKGKKINFFIGAGVGGGNDTTARSFARYYEKHIPGNPKIISRNYPGAGGIRAVIAIYNKGAKDGTAIGTSALGPVTEPLLRGRDFKYDLLKMNWIGSLKDDVQGCFVMANSPIKTIQDAMKQTVTIASTGANSNGTKVPLLLNAAIGTLFKPIIGYGGPGGAVLAIEQGETMGRCTGYTALKSMKPQWISQNKVRFLIQVSTRKHPAMKGVPWVMDMITDEKDRQLVEFISGPFAMTTAISMPPGVPKARVEAMRRAFQATIKDPAYLAESKKLYIDISPKTGAEVLAILKKVYATPKSVIKRAVAAFKTRKVRCDPKTFKKCRKKRKRKKKKKS